MRKDKARDHERVVAQAVELGVRETEDDCEHRRAYVAEQDGPHRGDLPILFPTDDGIQIAANLVALNALLVGGMVG